MSRGVESYVRVFIVLSVLAVDSSNANLQANETSQPNVLFIAIDDLNDWIGCLGGHPQAKTPNLDRLAQQSVNFTNAHCQAPICNPSRISLLTGMLPSSSGVYYLSPQLREWQGTRRAVSLPQHFAADGYRTLGAGKIFHAGGQNEFDVFAGNFGGFGPRPKTNLNCDHVHPLWDWGAFPETDAEMPDAKLADWTAQQLQQEQRQPFFLACGFFRPHVPLYVPQKWLDMHPLDQVELPATSANDLSDVPQYGQELTWSSVAPRHLWMLENNQWKKAAQAYLASISFVDDQVGKVLDALERSPFAQNTIVVLWSDHGFHIGTKERWGKRSLWEDSTKVVMMISVPEQTRGAVCDRPVGLIDLYPTLIELCGLQSKVGLEGHSLVPLLDDPTRDWAWPAVTTFGQNNHAIRSQNWRYITYADGQEELYNHAQDPHEFENLADRPEYESILVQHRRWLPQINLPLAPGSAHCDAKPGSAADIDGKPTFRRPGKPK